jgi:hypothetical protein
MTRQRANVAPGPSPRQDSNGSYGLVQAVAAGTRRIRAWRPTPPEARLADLADRLAETLAKWDLDCPFSIRRYVSSAGQDT